jgi:hypothetical protein
MNVGVCLALWLLSTVVRADEPAAADTATVRGHVVDAQTGQPIARARVSIPGETVHVLTDEEGRFAIGRPGAGDVEITVATVGYGVFRKVVAAGAGGELEIALNQDALQRSTEVTVTALPFAPEHPAAPSAATLEGTELKNLASVLTDDPIRSVQSLPGVAATDDFNATFAARGFGFAQVGFHVDGILLEAPFHTVREVTDGYSLTVVNGDVVESLSLMSGGAPAPFGDRIGPVLSMSLRDGSREKPFGRASLGATGLYGTFEGPIGARTSWLISARKSYLDYVLKKVDSRGIILGYSDATARLTHRPVETQSLSLTLLHGTSSYRKDESDLRPNAFFSSDAGTDLAALRWRWLSSPRSTVSLTAFAARETGQNFNFDGTERFRSRASQWGARTDLVRTAGRHQIEGGLVVRARSELGIRRESFFLPEAQAPSYLVAERYDSGDTAEVGIHLQDTWKGLGERLTLTLGGRFDRLEATHEAIASPRASFAFALSPAATIVGSTGEYAQFPSFAARLGENGSSNLRAERSRHYSLGLERLLGRTTRARVEVYEATVRDVLFDRASEWRVEKGRIVSPRLRKGGLGNVLAGRSRGVEAMIQRRSVNGLSGWVAYAFGHARLHEEGRPDFDSDFDQRHTVSVFGSSRLSSTVNLSLKFRYGSGFPAPGFFAAGGDGVVLSSQRNGYRSGAYSRVDVRANKAFLMRRYKLTLYAEVLNVLDHTNTRFTGYDIDPRTGRVETFVDDLFPLLPSAGITVEF